MSDNGKPKQSDEALLEEARERFRLVTETENAQRSREHEDLQFQDVELQWTDAARQERAGIVDGAQRFPPRPMVGVSLVDQPIKLVKNKAAKARFGVNIHPVDEEADDELAEIKQGLYRRIERDSNAPYARLWAFERALWAGRGWYRVDTKYDEDAVDSWDQEIVIKRILYQDTVYMDPAAQEMDCSDGEWAFVANWVPFQTFKRKFPDARFANLDQDFQGLQGLAPQWVRTVGKQKAVLVAQYFYKEHNYKKVEDKATGRKRETDEVTVWVCNITGADVLDRQKWNGKYIPLIPVIGRQLQPFDGEVRSEGLVRPARGAQRAFNHAISSVIEDVSRISKAPYIGAEGQFEGHEQSWLMVNVRNQPYVEYKNLTLDGKPVGPPQPMQVDGTKMQLSQALAEMAKGLVQSATAIYDPSLGISARREKSGRAVLAEQQQGDDSTADYLDNLAYAMRYEARVTLDLLPTIYDREGRITQVLGKEDQDPKVVMLNAHFVSGRNGKPMPAKPGQSGSKFYDLSKGKEAISVDIGKSHQTRLEHGQQFLTDVITAAPELMPVIGDLVFRFRDDPGAKEIAERLKRRIQATMPGIVDDAKKGTPDQLQAENSGLKQQLQVLQQQLQQAAQAIETDRAKQEASVVTEKLKTQAQVEIARMNNAAKIAVARITATKADTSDAREDQEERIALAMEQAHESLEADKDRAHETAMSQTGQTHEADQADADRTHEAEMGTMPAEPTPPGGGA